MGQLSAIWWAGGEPKPIAQRCPAVSELREGKRLSIKDFQSRLAATPKGAENFELLEGKAVRRAKCSLRHDGALEKLQEVLQPLVPVGWQLQAGGHVLTGESYVSPDAMIVRQRLPEAANLPVSDTDVTMVIEIADASLASDRRGKGRVYARADIPYYWLLNVLDRQLEVFSRPSGPVQMPGYQEQRIYRPEEEVSLVIATGELGVVRVANLLP